MTNPNGAKGSRYELDTVKYLREQGFPHAERLYGAGRTDDKGDITLGEDRFRPFTFELKNHGTYKWPEWMEEAKIECANAGGRFPIVIAKRRTKAPSQAYVMMDLEHFVELLKEYVK